MGGFDGFDLQGITQGVRHDLSIAEIAHESTSSSANGRDRCLLCRPVRQWRGRGMKLIRSPSPKGAGGGCIDLGASLAHAWAERSEERRVGKGWRWHWRQSE